MALLVQILLYGEWKGIVSSEPRRSNESIGVPGGILLPDLFFFSSSRFEFAGLDGVKFFDGMLLDASGFL